jgi:hypothetical protein
MRKQMIILVVIITKKIKVVLHLSKRTVMQLISDAKSYVDGISKNTATFATPNPSLTTVNVLIAKLATDETAAKARAKGAVAIRNASKKSLELALTDLAAYVESIANADPNNAESIAKLANMSLKAHTPKVKNDFTMAQGNNPGELIMTCKSESGRVTFNFEICTDTSNPANWKSVQNKSIAKVTVTGLVSGTRYYGRVLRTDKTGTFQVGSDLSAIAH